MTLTFEGAKLDFNIPTHGVNRVQFGGGDPLRLDYGTLPDEPPGALVTVVDPATLWPQDARAAAAALADEAAHAATLAAGVRMVAVPDGGDADPAADPDANQVPDA